MDENKKHIESAKFPTIHRPMNTWKHLVAHVCIWFLVIVLLMVYFTSTGSPQAGLLEVGASSLIFVVLFHLVMKFFPLVSKIITSIIVIGFGISLLFINYHYLNVVKPKASIRQLLVGDLLVNKILKTIRKEPITNVAKEEIPKTVLVSKLGKPSSVITPDYLKPTAPNATETATASDSLQVAPTAPVVTDKAPLVTEKGTPDLHKGLLDDEVARLIFTNKLRECVVKQATNEKDLIPSGVFGVVRETSFVSSDNIMLNQVTSPMFESISMKQLLPPLKEAPIPID